MVSTSTAQLARIRELFQPTLTFLGYELYDLSLTGTGGHTTLRVRIDRPEGVTLDDCERVSKSLCALLDQADPLPTRYDLEVSSPGAERPLLEHGQWLRALGQRVNVRFRSGEADTVVEGRLLAVGEDALEVEIRERRNLGSMQVAFADVVEGRLAVEI